MSATGTVNVGVSSSTVNVGTSQIGDVNIGVAGSTIDLIGTASVTTLNGTSASAQMSIGGNLTDGLVRIAQGAAFTGNIAIGANSIIRTGTINIGTNGSGTITIGNSNAPLALPGSTTTFSSPLTLGSLPGNAGQLGYTYTTGITQAVAINGSAYASITIGTAGVYLFTFGVSQVVTSLGTINYVTIGGTGSITSNFGYSFVSYGVLGSAAEISFNGAVSFQCTASTYSLIANTNSSNNATPGGFFRATRIA